MRMFHFSEISINQYLQKFLYTTLLSRRDWHQKSSALLTSSFSNEEKSNKTRARVSNVQIFSLRILLTTYELRKLVPLDVSIARSVLLYIFG